MMDTHDVEAGYNPVQMGVWRIQVGREVVEDGVKTFQPLSDWADAPDGLASFTIDLSSVTDRSAKVVAKADLVSPIPGYTRTAMSRPLYVAVLDGKQIEATLDAYRVTGEAPLRIAITASLEDRIQSAALGEVQWKVSGDDGATWTDEPPPYGKINATRLVRTFDRGTWLVKAELVNRNSGARFETQPLKRGRATSSWEPRPATSRRFPSPTRKSRRATRSSSGRPTRGSHGRRVRPCTK